MMIQSLEHVGKNSARDNRLAAVDWFSLAACFNALSSELSIVDLRWCVVACTK